MTMGLSEMVAHYSYKSYRLASLLAALCLMAVSPASAEDNYTIEKVTVDADGKDTTEARATAMAKGELEAFHQLMSKLAPANANELASKTPPATVSSLIHGFEVVEERMTAEHYHAVLTYHFSPPLVQPLLPKPAAATPPVPSTPAASQSPTKTEQPANAPAASTRKAVLVLPVYNETRSVTKLWQEDNKWRNTWYEAALESGGGLVVVPLGDMNDRVDVDDGNVGDATAQSLSRMNDRYGVGEIYVLTAFYNLRADPKPALEITMKRITATSAEVSRLSYTIRTTETLDTLMVRASNDIAKNIYKQQTIDRTKIEFQRQKEISARVNVSSIEEWVLLRKHLLTHGNIVGIRLTSITNSQTFMVIAYKGTPDMLGKTLVASGLRVMLDGDSLVLALK